MSSIFLSTRARVSAAGGNGNNNNNTTMTTCLKKGKEWCECSTSGHSSTLCDCSRSGSLSNHCIIGRQVSGQSANNRTVVWPFDEFVVTHRTVAASNYGVAVCRVSGDSSNCCVWSFDEKVVTRRTVVWRFDE